MPHYLDAVVAGPWVLAVVFVVAGLDALLPFMPSETTVVACGVAAAGTGRPHLALLIAAASAGAYLGDQASFRIGRRSTGSVEARLSHHRARRLHAWVRRLLHSRGGLVIVFARYLPGGRSATALAAGVVGYPAVRFAWYTAIGVVAWAVEAALIGDPLPDGVILRTRLLGSPVPARQVEVEWQIAHDEHFRGVVRTGRAGPSLGRPTRSTSTCAASTRAGSTSTGSGRSAGSAPPGGRRPRPPVATTARGCASAS